MHLDRLYHDLKIAIEFQGPQHFRATAKYDAKTVAGQKHRDQHKRRQCKLNEVLLIALQAEDLSLEGMLKKFEGKVPLRDLTGCQKIIAYLTQQSQAYLNSFSANF